MTSKQFEELTNASKNLLQLLFLVFVLLALFNDTVQQWIGNRVSGLARSGIESIKIGELELKLKQAQDAVKSLANNPPAGPSPTVVSKQEGPKDQAPPPALAPALQVLNEPGLSWAYVGQFQNGRFIRHPSFNVSDVPKPESTLLAWTDTYKRDALPRLVGQEWHLGQIIGVIKTGQLFHVRQVETIEDGNVWAVGSVVPQPSPPTLQ